MKHTIKSTVLILIITSFNQLLFAQATNLPLFQMEALEYQGAFRIPGTTYGDSNGNYPAGEITYNATNNSLFFAGFNLHGSIAEFAIPTIIDSDDVSALNSAIKLQDYRSILSDTPDANPQNIDRISGMYVAGNKLIVNAVEYYDAAATNTHTSLVLNNASDIANSTINGYYSLQGAAHASGWISDIPTEWQSLLGGSHITGSSSRYPINSRMPMGVSAFSFNISDFNSQTSGILTTTTLLDFDLTNSLYEDFKATHDNANYNVLELNGTTFSGHTVDDADIIVGSNNLWTEQSQASYGFIVPGTRTYFSIGSSGGHNSGIGYKPTQSDGNLCGGPCPYDADDVYNYYWLWDLNDLLAVKNGTELPYNVRPYAYGEFIAPFQTDVYSGGTAEQHNIIGGTFDANSSTLYLTLDDAATTGSYGKQAAILAYTINLNTLSVNNDSLSNAIKITSNPVDNYFSFTTTSTQTFELDFYNNLGQKILTSKKQKTDVSMLQSGVYIVKFQFKNGQVVCKRMIKN